MDRAGNREYLTPVLGGVACGDQRTGAQARLEDESVERESRNDPVAAREVMRVTRCARREFAGNDAFFKNADGEFAMLRRIYDIGAGAQYSDDRAADIQRGAMAAPSMPSASPLVIARPAATSVRAKSRAVAIPFWLALRLPTIAICGSHSRVASPATNNVAGADGISPSSGGKSASSKVSSAWPDSPSHARSLASKAASGDRNQSRQAGSVICPS